MCGSARSITSPSISSTRRSTPWAAGCCGPKFMVRLRISGTLAFSFVAVVAANHARHEVAFFDGHRLVDDAALVGVVAHLDGTDEREVLAEGVTDEAVVGEDAAQVGVTVEDDTEHVEGLALV